MKQVEEKLELEEPVELILEEGGGELELEEKDEEENMPYASLLGSVAKKM